MIAVEVLEDAERKAGTWLLPCEPGRWTHTRAGEHSPNTKASTAQHAAKNSHACLPLSTGGKEKSGLGACGSGLSLRACRCWAMSFDVPAPRSSTSTDP